MSYVPQSNGIGSQSGVSSEPAHQLLEGIESKKSGVSQQSKQSTKSANDFQLVDLCQKILTDYDESDVNQLIAQQKNIKTLLTNIVPIKEDDPQMKEACLTQILHNFHVIVETLLFVIMKQTKTEMQSTAGTQLRNSALETMTYVFKQFQRSKVMSQSRDLTLHMAVINKYRQDILIYTLGAYSPDIAPQHQCITNQVAEDLLE